MVTVTFDSSVGRAEDCRRKFDILRSLVRIRLEGQYFSYIFQSFSFPSIYYYSLQFFPHKILSVLEMTIQLYLLRIRIQDS